MKSSKKSIFQGVRKAQLIGMVRGIPETNLNLAIIFSLLRLDEVDFHIATDFKLINLILGLSVSFRRDLN